MKVYTKLVMDWDGNVLEELSYDYNGPLTLAGGGGSKSPSTTTQKTVAEPWKGSQAGLRKVYTHAKEQYESGGPEYFPGQTYVNRDPLEDYAQRGMFGYANTGLRQQAGGLRNAQMSMFNAPDVANNPYVAGQADVIERRLNRNLMQNQLPMIEAGAMASGKLGGSRQGIAQGQAIGRTNEAMGDALAQLYGKAYDSGLEQQARGVGFAPQSMQAGMMPYQAIGDVGAYRRGEDEMALQDAMSRHEYNENLPHLALTRYAGFLQGAPWGQTTTGKVSGGRSSSSFNPAGAVGGAMLGNMLFPGLGTMATVGGGLLGGLF